MHTPKYYDYLLPTMTTADHKAHVCSNFDDRNRQIDLTLSIIKGMFDT